MAEYRYYLIPDFMSHVFPQQFEEQAPTEFFSNTADLMKRYQQLREMPYNNEYTWNERTNLPYSRLTVGIDRRDPDGAVTIMQVRNGINYLCDDYRGPFADRNDKQLIEMAKQLLADDIKSISDISAEVGFDNFSYFSTVFKKYTGITPGEYRRSKKS
jgi:hypothetical protein